MLTLTACASKTFIAFESAWKLFHRRWSRYSTSSETETVVRRLCILFLVDRNILVNKAFDIFPEDALATCQT